MNQTYSTRQPVHNPVLVLPKSMLIPAADMVPYPDTTHPNKNACQIKTDQQEIDQSNQGKNSKVMVIKRIQRKKKK